MLTAQKSVWFEKIFAVYSRNLIERRFHAFRVSGLNQLREKNSSLPLLIYANHSSWWDGLAAFEISRRAALNAFVMMEEKHLKRLFLFRKLGAFSVDREKPRRAIESLNYAAGTLSKNPASAVWIFPQGKILPNDARPILFYNGMSKIIEKTVCVQVVPVAFKYEFLNEFKPEIFVEIGKIEKIETKNNFGSKSMTANFAGRLTELLDDLNSKINAGNSADFERLI